MSDILWTACAGFTLAILVFFFGIMVAGFAEGMKSANKEFARRKGRQHVIASWGKKQKPWRNKKSIRLTSIPDYMKVYHEDGKKNGKKNNQTIGKEIPDI